MEKTKITQNDQLVENTSSEYILEVKNLCKYFPVEKSFFGKTLKELKAVDDVSFKLKRGKTLGIVGESGCGKTTMGRTVVQLYEPSGGEIIFNGQNITNISKEQKRKLKTKMQIIFQDPYSSLSPRMPVGEIISEAVREHQIVPNAELKDYIFGVMKQCGLQTYYYERYPHEFSGGQRQRIGIARSLALKPELVICDEPVSALDVSIQAQIINLLKDLQAELGLTYIFISHDLSVVEHISDEVGVMYLGNLVEIGPKERIFERPLHPYTQALFSAVPIPDPRKKNKRIKLEGEIPSPVNPPEGCKFCTRCSKVMSVCMSKPPLQKEIEEGHFVSCHLYDEENKVD